MIILKSLTLEVEVYLSSLYLLNYIIRILIRNIIILQIILQITLQMEIDQIPNQIIHQIINLSVIQHKREDALRSSINL